MTEQQLYEYCKAKNIEDRHIFIAKLANILFGRDRKRRVGRVGR